MEHKVKLIFECHNYFKKKEGELDNVEFTDYVVNWWDHLLIYRRRNYEQNVET